MITLHGLKNCDTCRKALKALEASGEPHRFLDLRADGLDPVELDRWIDSVGGEALLNRRSTTWRGLPDSEKAAIDATKARALMVSHPTLIKRPVVDRDGAVSVGWP
jgi:arsenate reductase